MTPQNPQMPRRVDDPLLGGHACELTRIGRILLEIHGEIGVQAVERREVFDSIAKVGLCSVGTSAQFRG
jgi:hypothetical protein